MYLKFYYDSSLKNSETTEIINLLKELKRKKRINLELIDTKDFNQNTLFSIYNNEAIFTAVKNKYKVKEIFSSGLLFGKKVPALLVYKNKSRRYPENTYPHKKKDKIVSIKDFLKRRL
jgi:hypothetical protein